MEQDGCARRACIADEPSVAWQIERVSFTTPNQIRRSRWLYAPGRCVKARSGVFLRMASLSKLEVARCRSYATQMAEERYGLFLDEQDFFEIEKRIAEGGEGCILLRADHRGVDRWVYALEHAEQWLPVVYDRTIGCVTTFLPRGVLSRYLNVIDPQAPRAGAESDGRGGAVTVKSRMPEVRDANDPRVGNTVRGIKARLPALPDSPGSDSTVTEGEEYLIALAKRRAAVESIRRELPKKHPSRDFLNDEICRIAVAGKEARGAILAARAKRDGLDAGIEDPHDPIAIMMAAVATIKSMGTRLGWEVTEQERATLKAIQYFLETR